MANAVSIYSKSVQNEEEINTENDENGEETDIENEKTLFSQILFRDISPMPKSRKRDNFGYEERQETPLLIKVNSVLNIRSFLYKKKQNLCFFVPKYFF